VGEADNNLSGTETFNFTSQADAQYILVLTGFETRQGDYSVSIQIQSP
jgi:hypothetical protein